jgi:alpha-1,6-mannosyltransferase
MLTGSRTRRWSGNGPLLLWSGASAVLLAWVAVLLWASSRFGYDAEVVAMPIPQVVALLMAAGVAYLLLPWLIGVSVDQSVATDRPLLLAMVVAGLAARLVLFASEPILEDDYQRYLWDGAVTASGHSPYRLSPAAVIDAGPISPLAELGERAGPVLDRIGHPELTTLYPPGAQALFALAHIIEPFSLRAWRGVILAFDLAALAVLLALLRSVGRHPLWAALYWWNPVVLKELFNAAHMDGLTLPFVLAALLMAARRPRLATCALGLAFSIKFWPIILVPLIWRSAWGDWRTLTRHAITLLPFIALSLWPQIAAGLDGQAGVVAYASSWSRNSALFPALQASVSALLVVAHGGETHAPFIARGIVAIAMAAAVTASVWRPARSQDDLIKRATWLVAALVLLSPAQYPWYTVWLAPLLPLYPIAGFMLLPAALPLYELYFYFAARDAIQTFTTVVVWLIWIPVWAVLLFDCRRQKITRS